jgi:hypothetical protein
MKWKNVPQNLEFFCSFVYKISFDDGTFYIGYKKYWKNITKVPSTKYTESNWKDYNSSSKFVKKKIKNYKGVVSFSIIESHKNMFDSLQCEMNIIKRYRKISSGILNLTDGFTTSTEMEQARRKALSRSHTGKILSDETKEKLRQRFNDPYSYKRRCEINQSIAKDPKTIEKLKQYRDNLSTEQKKELSDKRIKARSEAYPHLSDEHKKNISNSIKQYYKDNPDKRVEKSLKMKKVLSNQEIRDKISNSLKCREFSDEHKKKLSESSSGKSKSTEHKRKLSEASKKQQEELYKNKPYIIEIRGIKYKTFKDAVTDTGEAFVTIKKRLNDTYNTEYRFINDKEEK